MKPGLKEFSALTACAVLGLAHQAFAQENAASSEQARDDIPEIIVTAQKRSEAINTVPMSINALTAQQLQDRGINNISDLGRLVPGFTFTQAFGGTPVFTLRGIGFFDYSLSAPPAVSIYVDQVPIPFSAMAREGLFDLERVEVLKGPQGTLFGANSTGGAINYIAASPTDTFQAGGEIGYGRFNALQVGGFVSGPLTDTLQARLAFQTTQGDGWQKSVTRGDSLGDRNKFSARLLLDWAPTETVSFKFNATGWRDRSESQAPQLLGIAQINPAFCTPNPLVNPIYPLGCVPPSISANPIAPRSNRAADWNPGEDFRRDDYFYLLSGRADIELTPDITLTSITAYEKYKQDYVADTDGVPQDDTTVNFLGDIESISQEVRLAGTIDRLTWVIGGNYLHDKINQENPAHYLDSGSRYQVFPPVTSSNAFVYTKDRSLAAFGNVDYALNDQIKLHAGIRYTDFRTSGTGGTYDGGDGTFAAAINNVIFALTGTPGTVPPGGVFTITLFPDASSPTGLGATTGAIYQKIKENNVSWRVGVDFTPEPGKMIYANVSRGYKAGTIPILGSTSSVQHIPVTQESVLAYEIGTKLELLNRKLQLNAAAFYYDYKDKQLRGRILDPVGIFGALEALVNVPKSRVYGVEFDTTIRPVRGLTISANGTYVNSKVTGSFPNWDPFATPINFKGMRFPYTPKWSGVADVEYEQPLSSGPKLFLGATLSYQSSQSAAFHDPSKISLIPSDPLSHPGQFVRSDIYTIQERVLVDARLGVASEDEKIKATLWAKNIFKRYDLNNVFHGHDTIFGYTGNPRTYGITLSYRM